MAIAMSRSASSILDKRGNAYVSGFTDSTDFPTNAGALDRTYNGGLSDAFVTTLNPSGSALIHSSYLGGSGVDEVRGIALDSEGGVYLTGFTDSDDFPTTPRAFDGAFNGGGDAFVTKFRRDHDDADEDDRFNRAQLLLPDILAPWAHNLKGSDWSAMLDLVFSERAFDNDYAAKSGTLTFARGETSKTITFWIIGDRKKENDETFSLMLLDAVFARIADGEGIGTIRNHD
jgi:hypothetical protein